MQVRHRYLDYLINPSFQRVKRLFFYHLKMMQTEQVTSSIFFRYFLSMIDRKSIFDQPVKNDKKTYDNIPESTTGELQMKKMIPQPLVYWIMFSLKTIIR